MSQYQGSFSGGSQQRQGNNFQSRGISGGGGQQSELPIKWRDASSDEIVKSASDWGSRWKDDGATSAQIRRYFGEVRRLELLVDQEGWDKHALSVKLLKAKAAYALRQEANKRRSTVAFIQGCVDKINSKDDFKHFVIYFEAALGFAVGFGLSDKEK